MATALVTDLARDALSAYLQAQVPGQIAAVNAARPTKHQLAGIQTWAQAPRLAKPQLPAIYLLAQSSGFRGAQWGAVMDESHLFNITVQVANQDEETLEADLIGYAAVVVNAIRLWWEGAATLINDCQFLSFGSPDAILYGPKAEIGNLFFGEVVVPITLSNREFA